VDTLGAMDGIGKDVGTRGVPLAAGLAMTGPPQTDTAWLVVAEAKTVGMTNMEPRTRAASAGMATTRVSPDHFAFRAGSGGRASLGVIFTP